MNLEYLAHFSLFYFRKWNHLNDYPNHAPPHAWLVEEFGYNQILPRFLGGGERSADLMCIYMEKKKREGVLT